MSAQSIFYSMFFSNVLRFAENVPVRNSDVDYRLLEAAKAGDMDTVKVLHVWTDLLESSCSVNVNEVEQLIRINLTSFRQNTVESGVGVKGLNEREVIPLQTINIDITSVLMTPITGNNLPWGSRNLSFFNCLIKVWKSCGILLWKNVWNLCSHKIYFINPKHVWAGFTDLMSSLAEKKILKYMSLLSLFNL